MNKKIVEFERVVGYKRNDAHLMVSKI